MDSIAVLCVNIVYGAASVIAFELMMLVTSACALVVSGWLWLQARHRRSLQALSGFGVMMALWCGGHVAIQQGWHRLGIP